MAARGMTREVLLAIKTELESKGFDEAKKGLLDLGKFDKKTFLSGLGGVFKGMIGNVLGLLNPLKMVHGLLGTVSGAVKQLGSVFKIGLGVAAGTAISTVAGALRELATSPVEVAARVEVLENGLRVMAATAGKSIDFVQKKVETLKKTGITTREAIESVTQFLSNQLPINNIENLARAAQDMAVVFGKNSSETFSRFVNVILTGNSELLRAVGIAKTASQMYDAYAATLGKTGEQLTTVERRQALLNGIMQAAAPYAGQYTKALDNVGKKLTSLPRYIEEAQLAIGRGFTPILNASVDILTEVLKNVTSFFEKHRPIFEGFGDAVADGLRTGWDRAKGFLAEITGALLPDFDPQAWFQGGVNLVVGLADGLLTGLSDYVIPACISIAETIASFLLGGSPPKRGPLSRLVQGAVAVMNTYLKSFTLADFNILNQVGSMIYNALKSAVSLGDLAESQLVPTFQKVRGMVAELIATFRQTGEISEEALGRIAETLGEGSEELVKYLRLQLEYQQAMKELEALQGEYAKAEAAGFVSKELKDKLTAAEEAVDAKAEELSWQEQYLRAQQDSVDLQVQQLQVMQKLTAAVDRMASAMKRVKAPELGDAANVAGQLAQAVGDIPKAIDEARQKWKETFTEMFSSFSRLETPLSKLGDFVKGFIGFYSGEQRAQMQKFGDGVSVAYLQGEKARETFNLLVEGIKALPGKVGEWLDKLREVQTWFEGLPVWVQNVLKGTAILAAVNVATGGMVSTLTAALVSVGLSLGPLGWGLAILATLVLTNKEELQRWFAPEEVEEGRVFQIGAILKSAIYEKLPEGTVKDWYDQNVMVPLAQTMEGSKAGLTTSAQQAIRDPIVAAGQETYKMLVGGSIVPDMVLGVVRWLTQMKTRATVILTALRTTAIQLFTQIKNRVIELVAEMVEAVLESLIELRDESGEILEDIAEIFEEMGKRIAQAVVGITHEIDKLIGKLEDLVDKAKEAMDAMQEAGIMGESPSRFETSLRGIAQAMSDLPSLTAEWTRTLNVNAMQPTPAVATSSSSVVIQNFFQEGAFGGAFPSVRTARDAGDFMREINALTERASARSNVPGGVK